MIQPDLHRRVRQHGGDIDVLYELIDRVDQRVVDLDGKVGAVDQRVADLDGKVGAVDVKVEALDEKIDQRFEAMSGQLAAVLRHLQK